jgi:DNA-binding transcriptional regulator YhcF (GntR family)
VITFRLRTQSGIPLYLQIVQQVRYAIQTGLLQEGDRLPTIKEVISTAVINPNTVAKAYRELEKDGLVQGRAGIGTIVLRTSEEQKQRIPPALSKRLSEWLSDAKKAGLTDETIEALLHAELHKGGHDGTDKY